MSFKERLRAVNSELMSVPMKILKHPGLRKRKFGFSLIELLVAMAITLIVLGAALMMFVKSMDTNDLTSQMAEMQANARAGANLLAQDLNQAGTGIPWGGISLPSQGGAVQEVFAIDAAGANYLVPNNFYNNAAGNRFMYGVTPDVGGGPTIGAQPMDGINIVYADPILSSTDPNISNWPLTHPSAMNSAGSTTTITMPVGITPAVNNPNSGILVGDMIMVSNGTGQAVGMVTSAPGDGVIVLGPNDPFQLNQSGAGMAGMVTSLGTTAAGTTTYDTTSITIMRLYSISYFLQPLSAAGAPLPLPGAGAVDYRLMRQINSLPPSVVAEHVDYLRFSYDLADPTCPPTANMSHISNAQEPPTCGAGGPAYDKIRTVYISLAARSGRPDRRNQYNHTTINTSIGPRSLSYHNTYPNTGT